MYLELEVHLLLFAFTCVLKTINSVFDLKIIQAKLLSFNSLLSLQLAQI